MVAPKITEAVCAIVNNIATRLGYVPRQRGMLDQIWREVNATHVIGRGSVKECLRQFAEEGQCRPKQGNVKKKIFNEICFTAGQRNVEKTKPRQTPHGDRKQYALAHRRAQSTHIW
jgi:hypothetical protein